METEKMVTKHTPLTLSIVNGFATNIRGIPYNQLAFASKQIPHDYLYNNTMSKGHWKVFFPEHKEREVVKITDICWAFWLRDPRLTEIITRKPGPGQPVCFFVSIDSGKTWSVHTQWYTLADSTPIGKIFLKETEKARDAWIKEKNKKNAKARTAKLKLEAEELGISLRELVNIKREERKTQKVVKKEAALTEQEVFHLQQRLKFSTALRKIESNLEVLLDVAKGESDIDTDRFTLKIKKANKIAAELNELVKQIGINRNKDKKKDSK